LGEKLSLSRAEEAGQARRSGHAARTGSRFACSSPSYAGMQAEKKIIKYFKMLLLNLTEDAFRVKACSVRSGL
jgi:hypothetical protein